MMNSRFWIPFGVAMFPLAMILSMCDAHRRPVRIDNDTSEPVLLEFSPYKLLEKPDAASVKPGDEYSAPFHCSNKWEFAYLSTKNYPDFVAYRFKDICDLKKCSCRIRVSYLESHRHDLSVPWAKAGSIFPPGARR